MNISIIHDDPLISAGIVHSVSPDDLVEICATVPHRVHESTLYICDYARGLELCRHPHFGSGEARKKIVMLTHFKSEQHIRLALENGVRGYLLQGCSAEELTTAITAVTGGLVHITEVMAGKVAEGMFREELTERERQVLCRVAEGWLNKMIADDLGITENTVKTHLKIILAKLDATSRTHAVVLAARRGIIRIE